MRTDLEASLSDSGISRIGPDYELSFLSEAEPRGVRCPVRTAAAPDHRSEPPASLREASALLGG